MAKVRAKARPWRYILALLLAIAGAVAAEVSAVPGWGHDLNLKGLSDLDRFLFIGGQAAFLVFGLIAVAGLSSKARWSSQQLIGQAHAGVLRYVLVLVGVFLVLTFSLALAHIDVKQLLVSGAVLGVLLGIAAQQSLANLVAGLVLLFARPFRVGDHVRFRSGALSGQIEGMVIDVSLTYVRLDTAEGQVLLPNSQALAAAVVMLPDHPPADLADVPGTGGVSLSVSSPPSTAAVPAGTTAGIVPGSGAPSGTVAGGTDAAGTTPAGTAH